MHQAALLTLFEVNLTFNMSMADYAITNGNHRWHEKNTIWFYEHLRDYNYELCTILQLVFTDYMFLFSMFSYFIIDLVVFMVKQCANPIWC